MSLLNSRWLCWKDGTAYDEKEIERREEEECEKRKSEEEVKDGLFLKWRCRQIGEGCRTQMPTAVFAPIDKQIVFRKTSKKKKKKGIENDDDDDDDDDDE